MIAALKGLAIRRPAGAAAVASGFLRDAGHKTAHLVHQGVPLRSVFRVFHALAVHVQGALHLLGLEAAHDAAPPSLPVSAAVGLAIS